jgi:hypothetical protein
MLEEPKIKSYVVYTGIFSIPWSNYGGNGFTVFISISVKLHSTTLSYLIKINGLYFIAVLKFFNYKYLNSEI